MKCFWNGFNTRHLIATALAMLLGGCAAPLHLGRLDVTDQLVCRTGYALGPVKSPCDVLVPDFVIWEDGLSEDEAAALGLWNNPGYQELLADLNIARSDVMQAGQLTNPEIFTLFPLGVKQWEFALFVPLDAVLLRPRRVAVAQLQAEQVATRLVQDGLNVIRDVRIAYADLVLAEQMVQLAAEGLELQEEVARIAEARLEAGAVAELDVSAMRLEALFGSEQVVRTLRDADLAREQLRFLLGVELTDYGIEPIAVENEQFAAPDLDELVSEALASRPDLRAVEAASIAACERAKLAKRDYFNVWGVLPDINSKGRKGFEAGPGVRFSLPIFNQNQAAIARAEAEAEQLRRRHAMLQDSVALEVRQAHTRLLQALERHSIWREQVLPQAETSVTAARQAMDEDAVWLLYVLETTRQLLTARQRELESAADIRRAIAELERSVGRSLCFDVVADMDCHDVEELPCPGGAPEAESILPPVDVEWFEEPCSDKVDEPARTSEPPVRAAGFIQLVE